jgi:hypothetical protein
MTNQSNKNMKQLTFLLLCLFLQSTHAQKEQVSSDIDFFDYVTTNAGCDPMVSICSNERDKNIVVPYFYCELSTQYEEKGMACLYAIPKHEYGTWRVNSLGIAKGYIQKQEPSLCYFPGGIP